MKMTEVVAQFDDATEEHDGYLVRCPVPGHPDSHQSVKLSLTDEGKVLLKCRAGCSQADLLASLPGDLSPRDLFAVEDDTTLSTVRSGTTQVSGAPLAFLASWLHDRAEAFPNSPAAEYVRRRFGCSLETAEYLGLGWAPAATGGFRFLSRMWDTSDNLVIPFRGFDDVPTGAQGRDLDPDSQHRWLALSNPDGMTWGKLAVFKSPTGLTDVWLVTEGPGDAITAAANGFCGVGIRGAALGNNPEVTQALQKGLKGKTVIICADADRAGEDFGKALEQSLSVTDTPVLKLTLPDGVGDLSEWCEQDRESFPALLAQAVQQASPVAPPEPPEGSGGPPRYPFDLNDVGNAEHLLSLFQGNLRYSEAMGFMLYADGVWHEDNLGLVRTYAQRVGRAIRQAGEEITAVGGPDTVLKWGKTSSFSSRIDAMLKEAKALPGVAVDITEFDQAHDLLAFTNGVVNLRTGVLTPFQELSSPAEEPAAPHNLLTRQVSIAYNPGATAPRWEAFLEEIMEGEVEMAEYLQRLVGYGITGETSEQCFIVLWGTGANGKSVFTDTLNNVMDGISTTTPFSTFEATKGGGGIPNDLAALKGSRLTFASEGESGSFMAEALLKRVTGQDVISARFLRKEFFEFTPTFLLFLATNSKPRFKGQDEGLWRRVKLIPFKRFFAPHERDHKLLETLRDEAEGIAAWCVAGAIEWYSRGGLDDPAMIQEATGDYRTSADALDGFYPGLYVGAPQGKALTTQVYRDYQEWCDSEGMSPREVWSRQALFAALEERGVARKKIGGKRYLAGIERAVASAPDVAEIPSTSTSALKGMFGESQ